MNIKKIWQETFVGFIFKNILLSFAIIIALSWIVLIGINFYTAHNESIQVPDLRGLSVVEAENLLKERNLILRIIDSVYVQGKKLGTIVVQNPALNSSVKSNRAIYVTINSIRVGQITLPDISDMSYRQADATLQSIGLSIESVEYTPSEYKDLVKSIKYRGRVVLPGTRLPQGSTVVLVVGMGVSDRMVYMPTLKGMNLQDATKTAQDSTFNIGYVEYDVTPTGNEMDYVVYKQLPEAGTTAPGGSRIFLYLSKDKSRANEKPKQQKVVTESEEEFF